ncbi:alanine racemase [Taklimakanibacter lacteus]|uniref:alanine racemase n=1 Tax=Taklimakanibacter lacteus TaxID=2268456 RepID=UPI000E6716D0
MSSKDITSFFRFEPVGKRIEELETPVPVIDIDVVDRNLKRWQARCDEIGIANRPHIKTHKLAALAKYQMALGAKGITVQKLGEAEVMADAGISDMLLTFNVVGAPKLRRLAELARRTGISVVADNEAVIEGLGQAGIAAGRDISVLVECDTGGKRNGVQSPEAAAGLARVVDKTRGVTYGGLMTYAAPGTRLAAKAFLTEARDLAGKAGLETAVVSTGGSPDMWSKEGLEVATEYRAGTYIYFDRSLAERGTCSYDDCALHVLATVVSRPTDERALIDAGSKTLTSDLLGLKGYGVVTGLDKAQIYNMSEEHGFLDISGLAQKPKVGDLVQITPNHVCPVTNLFDRVVFVRGNDVLGAVKVDARGMVQ